MVGFGLRVEFSSLFFMRYNFLVNVGVGFELHLFTLADKI